jgi:hypothetical protein
MRDQFAHIDRVTGRPNVTVQVLPHTAGAAGRGFLMWRLPPSDAPANARTAPILNAPGVSSGGLPYPLRTMANTGADYLAVKAM